MRDRMPRLGIARGTMNFEGIGFIQIRFKDTALSAKSPFDYRLVPLLRLVPRALETLLRRGGLRKNHQTRCLAMEAMHNPDTVVRVRPSLPEIIGELEVCRLLRFRFASYAEQILRFIDDDERGVF